MRRLQELAGGQARVVHFSDLDSVPAPAPVVVVAEGSIGPPHADALRRNPPALLLAPGTGAELPPPAFRVIDAVLRKDSLSGLAPAGIERQLIRSIEELGTVADRIDVQTSEAGAERRTRARAVDVFHELITNAMLAAPVDESGAPKYAHRRAEVRSVLPEEAVSARVWIDDRRLWMLVEDRFGRLGPGPLAETLARLGDRARLDVSGGGAGLGLRRVVTGSDVLAIRVAPNRYTEVLSVVELAEGRARYAAPAALFYYRG